MILKVRMPFVTLLYLWMCIFLLSCGDLDSDEVNRRIDGSNGLANQNLHGGAAQLKLTSQSGRSDGYTPFLEIDYQNSDFTKVIRCNSSYQLMSPKGKLLRQRSGAIDSQNSLERRAAWESALSSSDYCQLIGEKTVRAAFNDMLAPSGAYFYVFNPCREFTDKQSGMSYTKCSYDLISSIDISLQNTHLEQGLRIARQLTEKESQLTGLALRIREQMLASLEKQKSCENNEAVDAVREARQKALSAVLMTGIAASIGGVVGGPEGAKAAAKRTLQWIYENFTLGGEHNPTKCKILSDAETAAKETAAAIEGISNEIDQLKNELVQLYK
jgi:hypothetical protein